MHPSPKTLLIAAILLVASVSIAQEAAPSADSASMARLSYDNSGFAQPGSVMHVCFAVSKSGDYRIVRSLDGHTERLRGNMPKEEFRQLSDLLEAADFRNLLGNSRPGVVRQEAETFAAEIAVGGRWHDDGHGTKWLEPQSRRLQWLNGDGESPFPAPVSKLVDWLQRFQPKDGKPFDYAAYRDVCPAVGLRLLQPAVAENSQP